MATGRKLLFFLGAGASRGAGARIDVQGGGRVLIPIQATFWETFLRFCHDDARRRRIESFLFRYFRGYDRTPARTKAADRAKQLNGIDVEEVFTFLSERARAPSTTGALRNYAIQVWKDLVIEIGQVFSKFGPNKETKAAYRAFLDNHVLSRDVLVSFNWDTVFENSIPSGRQWAYESLQDTKASLRILKPHGSVNWDYQEGRIELSDSPQRPVIVAPTHLKFVSTENEPPEDSIGYLDQSPDMQRIWRAMESHMREAKAFVFIGYSFPVADLYFSSVLRSVIATRDSWPKVVIVNPDAVAISERLRSRFNLTGIVRYFDLIQFLQTKRSSVLAQAT